MATYTDDYLRAWGEVNLRANDLHERLAKYHAFLHRKKVTASASGFIVSVQDLNPLLFDWQKMVVRHALGKGKFCLFEGCGLGKTFQQLEWGEHVCGETGGDILLLAPLAVSEQTHHIEAPKFGVQTTICRSQNDVRRGINITNYEMLDHFDTAKFAGVILDECFHPDTQVQVVCEYGIVLEKSIKDIRPGEWIVSAAGFDQVADVHRRKVPYAIRLRIKGRDVVTSPNHPFFTRRGWVASQDLKPWDDLMETATALRLVRPEDYPGGVLSSEEAFLQSILFSEMADESARDSGEGPHKRSPRQNRQEEIGMVQGGIGNRIEGDSSDCGAQSNIAAIGAKENIAPLESHEAQTFRAWRKRNGIHKAAIDSDGCTWSELEGGICFVTGPTNSRLSHALQAGLGESRSKDRHRGGWSLASLPEGEGPKEGPQAGYARVESLEILESGHPDLEGARDSEGSLYFYDLGATRHPSFTVNGCLVHNSSILKSYDGSTRKAITEAFAKTPYRLACSATPAPNDHMELGTHAEFMGVMTRQEMLAMFFVHDGGDTSKWRLKGHAQSAFWKWVCSWAVMIQKPSDIGYSDEGYILPPLNKRVITVDLKKNIEGFLFTPDVLNLQERREVRQSSLEERVAKCAEIINGSDEQWVIWCDLNAESQALTNAIQNAVEVTGSDSREHKTKCAIQFVNGDIQDLVSKASIFGYGLNLQCCRNIAFVGLSDSFEQVYQAIRRCWRFGQMREVNVYFIVSDGDGPVLLNQERKERDFEIMIAGMVEHMKDEMTKELRGTVNRQETYRHEVKKGNGWEMHLGDSVETLMLEVADNSMDFSCFSPPFSSLYTYSASDRDMGNSKDYEEFSEHFGFLTSELFRVIKPGRLVAIHCMNLPLTKERDGVIGIRDFRGDIIRAMQKVGFIFHSEVTIWKDPVTAMQRTKAIGLLYKQLRKDSCISRQGIPDYLVVFRKDGMNEERVTKTHESFPVDRWQRYASPVWMDIDQSDTLTREGVREEADERHICCLQLGVIERAIELWTNPGDIVISPYGGIGSEGYQAIRMDRRYWGGELKESYWNQACANLSAAETAGKAQGQLFA